MKIAFASTDGVHINEHFGRSKAFHIYTLDKDGFEFIEVHETPLEYDDEASRLEYKIDALSGCKIVYVVQIGPKAANMVKIANIYPLRASDDKQKIEDALNSLYKLIKTDPPLWLKRIVLHEWSL